MAYIKQTFIDYETTLKAEHLQHIEDGIETLENEKVSTADLPSAVETVIDEALAEAKASEYFKTDETDPTVPAWAKETDAPYEATGNPVSVENYSNMPMSIKTAIEPIQSGSGTPSPDNVRPINGRTGLSMTHAAASSEKTYTVDFGQTIYGGEYDWQTGVLTSNMLSVNLSGRTVGPVGTTNSGVAYARVELPQAIAGELKAVCSHYRMVEQGATYAHGMARIAGSYVFLYDSRLTSISAANAILADENPQLVYEVAPTKYQFTANNIKAIQGENTFEGDGVISVSGRKDVYYLLDSLVEKIEELDGEGGIAGDDGYSPTIAVTEIDGGHRITITDVNGTQSFDVMNGADGEGGSGGGSGDMLKEIYDSNENGVVDDAEMLGGKLPSYYAAADHTHDGLIYSTEEKLTGRTWIDGRPTYERTFVVDVSTSGTAVSALVSDALGTVVNVYGSLYRTNDGLQFPINWYRGAQAYCETVFRAGGSMEIKSFNTGTAYVTVEYTKTTDAASS